MINRHVARESNQMMGTIIFAALAGAMAFCAVVFRPAPTVSTVEGVGDRVFPDFEDPGAIASLQIIRIDDQERKELQVVSRGGRWVLASHKDYPADAEDAKQRINMAAIALMDLAIVKPATTRASEHKEFGVLDPTDENAIQDDGAGTLVVVEDADGKKLAELIIGKQVKDNRLQRVVRRPSQNQAYVVNFDLSRLSSQFADWIEGDLLGIGSNDVKSLSFFDYTCILRQQKALVQNKVTTVEVFEKPANHAYMIVDWNAEQHEWELSKYDEFKNDVAVPAKMAIDQQLANKRLDNFKAALSGLRIIDAQAKPKSVRADLHIDIALMQDQDARASLAQRGFYPIVDETLQNMFAKEGEVRIDTYDFIRYDLRFGKSINSETDDGEIQLNRYLLVSAFADTDRIPKPKLEPVPNEDPMADDADEDTTDKDKGDKKEDGETEEKELSPREKIIAENKRKQEEYDQKVETAVKKATAINNRIGNWFYVISEGVYRELNLSRVDLIVQAPIDQGFGIDAFRYLEMQGLPPRGNKEPTN